MKTAICGSLILLIVMFAAGLGGNPQSESRLAASALRRTYDQTKNLADLRAFIRNAQAQARTGDDQKTLQELERIVDFTESLASGQLRDGLIVDVRGAVDKIATNDTVIGMRGRAIVGATQFRSELDSELHLNGRR